MMKWPERYRNGITMTSRERHVLWCRVKSPAIRLFDYQLMWTHIKETSKTTLLALCEGNSPVTSEVPTKGSAAANTEKASIWRRHRGAIWIRNKMGNTYNYLLLHSYHSIKYIISIRELLNHNCCVKKLLSNSDQPGLTPKHSVSQTPHQPGKDIWWLPGLFLFPLCLKMQL